MKTIIQSIVLVLVFPVVVFASSNWNDLVWNHDNWYVFADTASIEGTVRASFLNYNDLKVANATVFLSGTAFSTTTDANGHFSFSGVPPGSYTVTIVADNLKTISGEVAVLGGEAKIVGLPLMTSSCPGMYTLEELDQAVATERLKWDADQDGKIGLPEAIRVLQIISGMR